MYATRSDNRLGTPTALSLITIPSIWEQQNRSRSRHEEELCIAQRKSHAARVSHARRKHAVQKFIRERAQRCGSKVSPSHVASADQVATRLPRRLCGNSDPFGAFAIEVTPCVNLILTFIRDAVIPAVYGTPFFRACSPDPKGTINLAQSSRNTIISSHSARRYWASHTRYLQDEGMALAALAVHCDLIPQIHLSSTPWTGGNIKSSLHMRTQSMCLLREKLANDSGSCDAASEAVMMHVFLLFRAEHTASHLDAVVVHGSMLRLMVERAAAEERLTFQFLIQCLVIDAEHAVKFMTRPIFDHEGWCIRLLKPLWDRTYSLAPSAPAQLRENISETIELELVRSSLSELRYQLFFTTHPFDTADCYEGGNSDLAFGLLCTRSHVDFARMVSLYLDVRDGAAPLYGQLSPGQRYTQAALILNTLFIVRCWGTAAIINGTDIKDASPELMAQLGICVERMLQDCTFQERIQYQDAHLWILYGCALWERRQQQVRDLLDSVLQSGSTDHFHLCEAYEGTFTARLVDFCEDHKIHTVAQLQKIESKFIQTDLLQPHPVTWFEQTVRFRPWYRRYTKPTRD